MSGKKYEWNGLLCPESIQKSINTILFVARFFWTSEPFFIGCKIKFEKIKEKLNVQVGIKTSKIIWTCDL